jgi:hypothetical protein
MHKLEPGEIVFDEMSEIEGLDALDRKALPFEFTCHYRRYDPNMDAYRYHVQPVTEYDDLDFTGHTVVINGVERQCDDFEINDGQIVIIVNEIANDACT